MTDAIIPEYVKEILDAYDRAAAEGTEPHAWVDLAADELLAECQRISARRAQLIAELDRWTQPTGKN
jgi:hypothetical protein